LLYCEQLCSKIAQLFILFAHMGPIGKYFKRLLAKPLVRNATDRPHFGKWYYWGAAAILLLCNSYYAYRVIQDGDNLWEVLTGIPGALLGQDWGDPYSPWILVGCVIFNVLLIVYVYLVRVFSRVVYVKDPLRKGTIWLTYFNIFLYPVLLLVFFGDCGFGPDGETFATVFFYLLFLGMFGIPYFIGTFLIIDPEGVWIFDKIPDPHMRFVDDENDNLARNRIPGNIFDEFSLTSDNLGRHGEFDANDRDRAYNEDIEQFRNGDKDFDAEEHFGWEHNLNYESEGYPDEED